MKNMNKICFLAVVIGASTSLQAAPVYTSYERYILGTDYVNMPQIGNTSPQNDPTLYTRQFSYGGNVNAVQITESAIVSTNPVPFVAASTFAIQGNYYDIALAQMTLAYSFNVLGPANTWIPINFMGEFYMHGPSMNGLTDQRAFADASVSLAVNDAGGLNTTNGSAFTYSCNHFDVPGCHFFQYNGGPHADVPTVTPVLSEPDNFKGEFKGGLSILTGADGWGSVSVTMVAYTDMIITGQYQTGLPLSDFASYAQIDPFFEIDQSFLDVNPDARLVFQDRIANASFIQANAVPEPNSLALLALGLVGLTALRKSRQIQSSWTGCGCSKPFDFVSDIN